MPPKVPYGEWSDEEKARILGYRKTRRKKARAIVDAAKAEPCMDCGGTFPPYVMDFDHRPGETKVLEVTQLAAQGRIPLLAIEIAKCDLVCANCHRIRTHLRRVQDAA